VQVEEQLQRCPQLLSCRFELTPSISGRRIR
jgi:hypothetical protein